jgi:DNA gyrase subunit A
VIKKIADLVNDKVIPEVHDVKDLSDKSGMRIQIELKRDAVPQVVQNKIFKHTPLQTTFGYNAVALVDGVPRTLPLRDLLCTTSTSSARSSPAARSSSCARPRPARTSCRAT